MINKEGSLMRYSIFAFLSLLLFISSSSTAAQKIVIGGTGNALGTMKLLSEKYQELHPEIEITVLPSIGSSGAIKAVPLGKIDIGLSSRPFKETEFTGGATALEYARSPTVIAVSNRLSETDITVDMLSDIYMGKMKKWKNGDLIRPILRQANDGNTKQLNQLSEKLMKALIVAENNDDFLFASTDQEAVDKLENIPGSIGVTTLALILSEKRDLHAMSLDGIEPSVQNSEMERYPMAKQYFFILPKNISTHALDFVHFVQSPVGKSILESYGNYAP